MQEAPNLVTNSREDAVYRHAPSRGLWFLGSCQAHNVPQSSTDNKLATNKGQRGSQTWTEHRVMQQEKTT